MVDKKSRGHAQSALLALNRDSFSEVGDMILSLSFFTIARVLLMVATQELHHMVQGQIEHTMSCHFQMFGLYTSE